MNLCVDPTLTTHKLPLDVDNGHERVNLERVRLHSTREYEATVCSGRVAEAGMSTGEVVTSCDDISDPQAQSCIDTEQRASKDHDEVGLLVF